MIVNKTGHEIVNQSPKRGGNEKIVFGKYEGRMLTRIGQNLVRLVDGSHLSFAAAFIRVGALCCCSAVTMCSSSQHLI